MWLSFGLGAIFGAAVFLLVLWIGAHQAAASTDPGVALYQQMHARGATMPASWAQTVDANHAVICSHYNNDYAGYPPGDTDEYGVTVPMAKAAIAASGFCASTR